MLRASNVLNEYFKQKKILKYFSLPHGEYIIEYKIGRASCRERV